jgi:hypothetical protein
VTRTLPAKAGVRTLRSQNGQALIEFTIAAAALLVPLFLINSRAGPLAPLTGSLSSTATTIINNAFDIVPYLNWNMGGVRIPIVTEAVIRMQTPYQLSENVGP